MTSTEDRDFDMFIFEGTGRSVYVCKQCGEYFDEIPSHTEDECLIQRVMSA